MSTIVQTSFDYTTVSTEQALALRMAAERVRLRLKRTAEDIIAIGQELIVVKADLNHGQFLGWLQLEFEMSESAALKFMHVAHRFESKSVIITDLPITILYQLSAPLLAEDIALTVAEQVVDGDVERTNKAVKAAKAATEQAQRSEQAALPTVGALSFFGQCACTKLAIAPTAFALRTRYPLCVTTVYKNLTRSYIHVQYR